MGLEKISVWVWAGLLALSLLLHFKIFFKRTYAASLWALKPERHKAWKILAYTGALPLRLVFALVSTLVAHLIWGGLLALAWALWKAGHS